MASNADRTSSLLNLLKFSGSGTQPQETNTQKSPPPVASSPTPTPTRIHQPAPTTADPSGLLAALMKGASNEQEAPPPAPTNFANGSPPPDTRAYLLNLLNRPKPSQTDQPLMTEAARNGAVSSPEATADTARFYTPYQAADAYQIAQQYRNRVPDDVSNLSSFSGPAAQGQDGTADVSALYQQLMGSLTQSSPQQQPAHILKKEQPSPAQSHHSAAHLRPGNERSPLAGSPEQQRRFDRPSPLPSYRGQHSAKHTPTVSDSDLFGGGKHKEAVADAVGELAEQVDHDARKALDEAEKALAAESDSDLKRSGDDVALSVEAQIVDTITQSLDAARSQAVADSWESADQEDEIVVIEEKEPPPVRVYNFPMKPWISISLQETANVVRPEFRDESIMDIARLKKEFDQVDRNLYTATQTYMTYGMSKQGGLRVIRQDDGKDAKVFTDTKDRIFNIAMSVTPADHDGVARESILGTGISGTVYWVQIKDGEKDHIEDPHLEQYGFALPPISTVEGDAPGGVLKTRARASTIHPEYFAVGRGKSINFIWPSYILKNKLFKSGHDRVVDTEALLKQSSLKINTGKAGKDFAFSQDDSVVVSLDKSGRVKFWDVRELTAIKEGSDPRAPLPAQSAVEIKEPIMTLATTPEGEKAWPTSVLLLDKQRPYQKRCALRYMIVGMKQNHTLQLWDLALGKPVQEFNLPHSKESDAVCSVMYHPASGMIVIGHPTRNSVYFAHLSAPKYNLKSVSQADYIRRLIAQDASIQQPDSTAVISGVREYSFANRGILRSLDILCNPAMVQDADEPTLFELYAMHSKGVACVLVKQGELGWSNDNKVLDAVDAVKEGVVTVAKLKAPQQTEPGVSESSQAKSDRVAAKEPLQQSPLASALTDTPPQVADVATPAKPKNEPKEETPVQSSKEGGEKSERKSRKKKGAAKEGAAKETEAANGTPNAARSAPASTNGTGGTGVTAESLDTAITAMQTRLTSAVSDTLKSSLKSLQGKIDDGARARDESFNQHQVKLLDMVSEVLNENTQKVLESLIHHQFTELVIPAIGDKASRAVTEVLHHKLQPSMSASLQKEIQSALPHAMSRALRSGDFVDTVAERVGSAVAGSVQQEVAATLTQRLTPAFQNIALQSAQHAAGEIHQQYHEQFEQMKAQRAADSNKMDQLQTSVVRLTDMVSAMVASQSSLQAELLKLKQQPVHELPGATGGSGQPGRPGFTHSYTGSANPPLSQASYPSSLPQQSQYHGSPEYVRSSQHQASPHGPASKISGVAGAFASQTAKADMEVEHDISRHIQAIEQAMSEGRLQDAMIQWIQSGHEKEIFQRCLSLQPPSRFEGLPPLMLLVVIATLSKDLRVTPRLKQEIAWIETAVRSFGNLVPHYLQQQYGAHGEREGLHEVARSASQTMQLLISRVTPLLAAYETGYPVDAWLASVDRAKMEWIVTSSEHILQALREL